MKTQRHCNGSSKLVADSRGNKCVCATVRWLNVVVRTHLPLGRVISMLSHKSINRLHKGQNAVTMTFIFKV